MHQALLLKQPENVTIPSEHTIYRVMEEIGICHHPKRKPNGITQADREARKSDDLLKRDFSADQPLTKCITDITEIKARDGKLYVSAIFDCFDTAVVGLAMDTNMKAPLCVQTLENAIKAYPDLRGAIIHSDRGSQYTSQLYRDAISKFGIQQSMGSVIRQLNYEERRGKIKKNVTIVISQQDTRDRKKQSILRFGSLNILWRVDSTR